MLVLDPDGESNSRKGRNSFPLTPLADAMFQLLIFFMLTAGLSPYSLLTLQSGPSSVSDETDRAIEIEQPTVDRGAVAVWTVDAGRIQIGGQDFAYVDLPRLVDALATNEIVEVVLISTSDASVQDLALVLEELQGSGVAGVQLVRAAGG